MDNANSRQPRGGPTAVELTMRGRRARIDLDSSRPSRNQALDLTRALASHWTQELSDDRLDAITQVWLRFPLPVCAACVHPDGIAATKIRDPRTGRQDIRRFVPSNPEIRDWLDQYSADLHEIAKAGESAARPVASPSIAPTRQPPTPEEIARVWQLVADMRERCKRDLGIPTAAEQREAAERFLEAATR